MTTTRSSARRSLAASATGAAAVRAMLAAVVLATLALPVATATAQGTLSTQGFGNPTGGWSPRSAATAGANAEFDPLAASNPAAIAGFGRAIIAAAWEPEFRQVRLGDVTESSRIQRIPMLAVGGRVRNVALLLSTHTMLDRTFATVSSGSALVGGQTVATTDATTARGAINDLRLGAAYVVGRLRVGAAAHALVGEHVVSRERSFPDTLQFGGVADTSRLGYAGVGWSLGVDARLVGGLVVAGSWRGGGELTSRDGDVTRSRATAPGRLAAAIAYDGLPGAVFSASVERVDWSAMDGLGSENARGHDATNWAVGGELIGGSLRGSSVIWRAGVARRELAFTLDGAPVRETRTALGVGLPLSGEFGVLDVAAQRALRRVGTGEAREDAWVLTVGLRLRP